MCGGIAAGVGRYVFPVGIDRNSPYPNVTYRYRIPKAVRPDRGLP